MRNQSAHGFPQPIPSRVVAHTPQLDKHVPPAQNPSRSVPRIKVWMP